MKIGICDDDPQELADISSLLEDYSQNKGATISYEAFGSGVDLLAAMPLAPYDLLLLDVIMPHFSGMQAAHEIRTFNKTVKIVFLTSSPEFAVESYAVKAYNYLLKPITREKLFPLLDQLIAEELQEEAFLPLRCKSGCTRLPLSRLSYVEVSGKILLFHLCNGTIYEASASLSQYEAVILSHPQFIKTHRSFLVNLSFIQSLDILDFITLTGERIPISRRLYPQAREAFVKSLFHS